MTFVREGLRQILPLPESGETMKNVLFAALLVFVTSVDALAQFRVYPRIDPSDLLNEAPHRRQLDLLPAGDLNYGFEGSYDLSVQVAQLYISPDIEGWNWYLPILVATSPDGDLDEDDLSSLARSLAGEGQGVVNGSIAYTREWRGPFVYSDTLTGIPDTTKSLTGLWLETGGLYKGHVTTALVDGHADSDFSQTLGAFVSLQGQITLSDKKTLRDLRDLRGVLYARIHTIFSYWLNKADNLEELIGSESLGKSYVGIQGTLGYFIFDGGAAEVSFEQVLRTGAEEGITSAADDLEEPVFQAGFRLVPSRILGLDR